MSLVKVLVVLISFVQMQCRKFEDSKFDQSKKKLLSTYVFVVLEIGTSRSVGFWPTAPAFSYKKMFSTGGQSKKK